MVNVSKIFAYKIFLSSFVIWRALVALVQFTQIFILFYSIMFLLSRRECVLFYGSLPFYLQPSLSPVQWQWRRFLWWPPYSFWVSTTTLLTNPCQNGWNASSWVSSLAVSAWSVTVVDGNNLWLPRKLPNGPNDWRTPPPALSHPLVSILRRWQMKTLYRIMWESTSWGKRKLTKKTPQSRPTRKNGRKCLVYWTGCSSFFIWFP